jgi:ribulose-phosphate 3-epimerase
MLCGVLAKQRAWIGILLDARHARNPPLPLARAHQALRHLRGAWARPWRPKLRSGPARNGKMALSCLHPLPAMTQFRIAPSILSADFARLGEEVRNVVAAGADWIHFDVMDNHYVPNLTIGPLVCEAIRPHVNVPIDVHLMVRPVDRIVPDFAKAGANLISFHPEGSDHIDRTLSLIRDHGCKAGLVFNPATSLNYLDHVMDKLDLVLIMSVNPGFGGQSFIPEALNKLREARKRIDAYKERTGREIHLEVDGGVKVGNIAEVAAAGADTFVAGSAIFGQPDHKVVIDKMRAALANIQH